MKKTAEQWADRLKTLTNEERRFWKDAFLAALPQVARQPWSLNQKKLNTPEGVANVAALLADESLRQFRLRR